MHNSLNALFIAKVFSNKNYFEKLDEIVAMCFSNNRGRDAYKFQW